MTSAAGRATVDPRLRQRRVAVRRAQGRRRLRILAVLAGLVAVAAGGYGLTQSRLLDLDTVEIQGVSPDLRGEVAEAVAVELGTPLAALDLSSIAESAAALPWVRSAEARRSWPGSLHISVVKRTPAAMLPEANGRYVLVDEDGVAIDAVARPPDDRLMLIDAAPTGTLGDTQTAVVQALAVVAAMPLDLSSWVEAVTLSEDSRLGLDLVGSARADLGDAAHIEDKLEALRSVLASVDLRCIELIDVRVADVATVQRDRACELRSA